MSAGRDRVRWWEDDKGWGNATSDDAWSARLLRRFGKRGLEMWERINSLGGSTVECYSGGKQIPFSEVEQDDTDISTWMSGVDERHKRIVVFKAERHVVQPATEAGETGVGWGYRLGVPNATGRRPIVGVWCFCPKCKEPSLLSVHTIRADGVVTPSYVCPDKKCGYHEFVNFAGWPGVYFPTQGFEWDEAHVSVPGTHKVRKAD